ncbi:MAG TPA: PDDEXK nuclease domain-containing protein [Planctomycetota bacterium]|mgnify:CR=1 FL=1|nr:PDDEXK nuclease domain-containing protein [Planctomycetota bacterium]HRR79717.1 PDDEXK nuclease domain-containing protein [Planctomycetota bacterium]HRT93220.1 PDDEXK nuclease domain-containing protein [Planctomycetota bacterium]
MAKTPRSHRSKVLGKTKAAAPTGQQLLGDIRSLIESARERTARAVNAGLVTLYWSIGARIRQDILRERRAGYGEQIVSALSRQLVAEYGSGFSAKSLHHMVRFAEAFPDERIVSALRRQLSWTHFKQIIYLDDPLKRDFYAEMCRIERWSTRTLQRKIGTMLFERTALAKRPEEVVKRELAALRDADKLTPDLVFRDPYILDFLGLKDSYGEKDVESAILRELESFILEMGVGFTFAARQKRISVDHRDYYLDLLFYHRTLRRLVAIDLKLDRFQAEHKGQMELYLRWLDRYERQPGEEPPIGLILCAGKTAEHVELLQLAPSGIRIAEYLTELPPRGLLERKLHEALRNARAALAARCLPKRLAGKTGEKA